MWKSWGDKYEIISYSPKKRSRKIKGVSVYIVILVILYILSMGLITHLRPEASSLYYYIPSLIGICSGIVSLGLFFLKWKKNDNECDLALIVTSVIFAFMSYIAMPDSTVY